MIRAIRFIAGAAFRADRPRAVLTIFLAVIRDLGEPLTGLALAATVNVLLEGDRQGAIAASAGLAILVAILFCIEQVWEGAILTLEERTGLYLQAQLTEATASFPTLDLHDDAEYQRKLAVLRSLRGTASYAFGPLTVGLGLSIRTIATCALLALIHPLLLLAAVFAVPLCASVVRAERVRRVGQQEAWDDARAAESLYRFSVEPGPAKEIRTFRLETFLLTRHRGATEAAHSKLARGDRAWLAGSLLGWVVFILGFAGILLSIFSGRKVAAISPGEVVLALYLIQRFIRYLAAVLANARAVLANLHIAQAFMWVSDEARRRTERSELEPASVPTRVETGLTLDGVSFTYPGSDRPAVSDVSLSIPAGSTVALVGPNGAGKTSLLKLLAGMYDYRGVIRLDGIDIRRFDLSEWRARCTVAFQDTTRFEFLVREAVGIGSLPSIEDRPAVSAAVVRAGAEKIVERLPLGLESQLGSSWPEGVDLSAGQWQMVGLSRAMMRTRPFLLILDEPTSSLDAENEARLFRQYRAAASSYQAWGAILFLVSQRLSSVRDADLICVIDSGRLVEVGRHAGLVEGKGIYARMFQVQADGYRDDRPVHPAPH